jgi:hypothetical protein
MKMHVLRNLKSLFRPELSDLSLESFELGIPADRGDRGDPSAAGPLACGFGRDSPERLRMSFPRRLIFDYVHLVPPLGIDLPDADRFREQVRESLREGIGERRSAEEAIQSFAELLLLCGLAEGSEGDPPMLDPLEAVEAAEVYYKRITLWQKAVKDGAEEHERIKLSKAVYASEHQVFGYLDRLRGLFSRPASAAAPPPGPPAPLNGNGVAAGEEHAGSAEAENGVEAEDGVESHVAAPRMPVSRTPRELFESRMEAFRRLRDCHAIEEAYITYKEKTPPPPPPPVERERYHEEPRRSGGLEVEGLVQLFQAMSLLQGGARPQVLDGDKKGEPEKKTVLRQFKADGDFDVKDKERLLQLLAHCEAGKVKFEKDYETLEALVYRKPHQVVLTLAAQLDDPVFYK